MTTSNKSNSSNGSGSSNKTFRTAMGKHARRTFTHGERSYPVIPITQAVKARYEDWLVGQAQASVLRLKGRVSRDEWREAWNATLAHTVSGAYVFGGEICTQAVNTRRGLQALAAICLSLEDDPEEMEALYEERREDVETLVTQLWEESFPNSLKKPQQQQEEEPLPVITAEVLPEEGQQQPEEKIIPLG